jgi:hypothetical protein
MVFSANNQQNNLTFDFNSTLIQTVNPHKHLGVMFSCSIWSKPCYYSSSFSLYFFQSIRVDSSTIIPHFSSPFHELIPPTVAESNNYNLRNRHNISQPANRLSKYQNSFFPSTIKTWNTLDLNIFYNVIKNV